MEDARLITPRSAKANLNSIYLKGRLVDGAGNAVEDIAEGLNNVSNEGGETVEDCVNDYEKLSHD